MTAELVVRSRRVVTPAGERPADVVVAGGLVVEVAAHGTRGDAAGGSGTGGASTITVDVGEDALLPGLVDSHVHVNDPGRAHWEGFATATRAAAAGGVTTIVDMPLNSVPPTVDAAALAAKRDAATGRCAVDVAFWGGLVPGNLDRLPDLVAAGARGVKCFLVDSGVPEFPAVDPARLAAALPVLARLGVPVLVHAEDPHVLQTVPPPAGPSYRRFLASRPSAAEDAAVARLVDLCARTGARVHVVHVASAGVLPLLRRAHAAGVPITAETCPHYLTLAADDVPDGATEFKCCPPVREAGHRDALWQGLGDGTISMVVSDHSPCSPQDKRADSGDFALAWGGISSLQLGLPLVWTEARRRGHRLEDLARWMSCMPARLAALPGKGSLEPGRDADLVAFAPEEAFVVEPGRLHHRHRLTPYAGRRLHGVVRRTWLRGREVHGPNAPADAPPGGRLLPH